jgi:hypothetical protein
LDVNAMDSQQLYRSSVYNKEYTSKQKSVNNEPIVSEADDEVERPSAPRNELPASFLDTEGEIKLVDKSEIIDKSKMIISEKNFPMVINTFHGLVSTASETDPAAASIIEALINDKIEKGVAIGKSVADLYKSVEKEAKKTIQNKSFLKLLGTEIKNTKFVEDENGDAAPLNLKDVVVTGISCLASCLRKK